ncbi:MAG: hypothetical protein IKM73_06125 [Acidaminococcaceae bacterium]|nr:hypothetical protein [Acidaminococcaceae bacterium]
MPCGVWFGAKTTAKAVRAINEPGKAGARQLRPATTTQVIATSATALH